MDTRTLSICSGYGGIELGLSAVIPGIRTVCYVEREVEACEILGARIKDGVIDDAPIWTDLRTFDATAWRGQIHILTGGFPCQPHSVAGLRKGESDPRELSGEVLRIADELGRPTLFLENVPGIKKFWFNNVRPKLQGMGYRVEEVLVTASETGAPHKRQRLFILAHPTGGRQFECFPLGQEEGFTGETDQSVAYPDSSGSGQDREQAELWTTGSEQPPSDSRIPREGEDGQVEEGRCEPDRPGSVDDSETERPQGEGVQNGSHDPIPELAFASSEGHGRVRRTGKTETVQTKGSIRLYPPGPSDTRGWEHVFSQMPSLIPTFCRVANGSTPRVSRQLRAGGNGVVPAMAARAWQLLVRKFDNFE